MNKNQIEPSVEKYLDDAKKLFIGGIVAAIGLAFVLVLLGGCATGAERPPSAWETKFYTIQTNLVPQVHVFTNTVTVTQTVETVREVLKPVVTTHADGSTATTTNVVTVTNTTQQVSYTTNVVTTTNVVPEYAYTPNANAAAVKEGGGAIGGLFGVGGLATTLIGGLFGIYGTMRSSKNGKAAAAAVQGVEMAREVLRTTPQGQALDSELVKQLMSHQQEAGVIQHIAELVAEHVDNEDARDVAQEIAQIIQERTAHAAGAPSGTAKV